MKGLMKNSSKNLKIEIIKSKAYLKHLGMFLNENTVVIRNIKYFSGVSEKSTSHLIILSQKTHC